MDASKLNFDWGGASYPAYDLHMNASAATGAPPAPDAPPPGGGNEGTGGGAGPSGPGTDGAGSSTAASSNDANIRTLREGYDKYKSLGEYDQVAQSHQTFTKIVTEANTLGGKLGYDAEDIKTALKEDPIATLAILRREAKAAESRNAGDGTGRNQHDINKQIKDAVAEATKPFNEQLNRQAAEKANLAFDGETDRLINADLKGMKEAAPKAYNLLYDMVSEIFKYDAEGLKALKTEGKVAGIQKAWSTAKQLFADAVTEYQGWTSKQAGGGNAGGGAGAAAGGGQGGAEKLTLDDIISGSDNAKKQIKSFR